MRLTDCRQDIVPARLSLYLLRRHFLRAFTSNRSRQKHAICPKHSNTPLPLIDSSSQPLSRLQLEAGFDKLQRRLVASFANQHGTVCVFNPQKDEQGREKIIEITARAAKRLCEIMRKDINPDLALRIQVESGGCHGFQYLMRLVTLPSRDEDWSAVVREGDTIFQYSILGARSNQCTIGQAKVIVDQPSLDLLRGSKIDFTLELIGSQFKVIDNPHATSSCGCGTSFDIEVC